MIINFFSRILHELEYLSIDRKTDRGKEAHTDTQWATSDQKFELSAQGCEVKFF